MDELDHCPLCRSDRLQHFKACRDHTVSGETFDIVECDVCGFRFTNPRPSPDEIGQYYESDVYTPHQDTGHGLIDSLYRWIRLYTLRSKQHLIASLVADPPGRLLDFGCGTGEFLNLCQSKGWKVRGLDPSPRAQKVAKQKYGLPIGDPEQIGEMPSDHFDVITLWHVLEHVPRLSATVEDLKRLLSPTGTLVVSLPNCTSLDANVYGEHWAAYDVPRHLYHFRPDDVHRLFNSFGMKIDDIRPMRLDAFYVSLLSEQYRDGWVARAPLVALLSNLKAELYDTRHSAQLYLIRKNHTA